MATSRVGEQRGRVSWGRNTAPSRGGRGTWHRLVEGAARVHQVVQLAFQVGRVLSR